MKRKNLFALWGGLYGICAALGFISGAENLGKALLILAGLSFFAVGFALLRQAQKRNDRPTLVLLRDLSALSLGLTAVVLALNFWSVGKSQRLGDILNSVLVIVSSPMFCCQYWVISLFLWACLMLTAAKTLRKSKNRTV